MALVSAAFGLGIDPLNAMLANIAFLASVAFAAGAALLVGVR